MAVIKYEINGKSNTKPIKDTEAAAQGMFKKIEGIDNKLKSFVGFKIFAEVSKTIKNAAAEYDKFQASVNKETNAVKQFDRIKTAFAGTIGTLRDELFNSINNIVGDGFKKLETAIPKIGAGLIASLKVGEAIVKNIKGNFFGLLGDFFSLATGLAGNFCSYFLNLLKDVFGYSAKFFKEVLEQINIFELIWTPFKFVFSNIFKALGKEPPAWLIPAEIDQSKLPEFSLSDETKRALSDFNTELGDALSVGLLNALAGTNVKVLFDNEYGASLERLNATIAGMNEARTGEAAAAALEELKKTLADKANAAVPGAADKFSSASSYIEGLLKSVSEGLSKRLKGLENTKEAKKAISEFEKMSDAVSSKMEGLNKQFDASQASIQKLFGELQNAKDAEAAQSAFDKIREQLEKIGELSGAMEGLEKSVKAPDDAVDFTGGIIAVFGDVGAAINALVSGNQIGLIITLISRLVETFSKISGPFAAFMNVFDVFFDVVEEIIATLEPALGAIFTPILDVVQSLARVFGMLLNVVIPIAAILNLLLVPTLKLLQPILYGIGWVFAVLADAIAAAYNFISDVVEGLTFGFVDMGRLAADNRKKMELQGVFSESSYGESQNSNNSTSYSVAGDMYININFSHSYVNGDSREIAIMLRDEIRLAEGAGY
jgi:hypothetical protein